MLKHLSIAAFVLTAVTTVASAQFVHPGDRLVVRILGGPSPFGDSVVVDGNLMVVLPKLGPTSLAAYPLPVLADSLRDKYARYLRYPTVEVTALRRIIVGGEVRRPDVYYADLNMTLPDVIAHAGGLTEAANNKVSIRRDTTTIPVPDWQTSHSSLAELQSGDQIIVGRRPWIMLNIFSAVSTAVVVTSLLLSLR